MAEPIRIVFAIYPGMTQLDFTGPFEFLRRVPDAETIIASAVGGAVEAEGLTIAGTTRLSTIPDCTLICVPGGVVATAVALDQDFIGEVKRLAGTARYITSVCTGSLILGAAGLLKNKRAACHWAWRDLLPLFGAIPDPGRVVRDGNIITGGGVTAGIDFALTVVAELAGPDFAQTVQLGLEYAPAPPFNAGRPELAPPNVVAGYSAVMEKVMQHRRAEAEAAAARL
jgi:transcriptional regulator GlxA family with amidase domain